MPVCLRGFMEGSGVLPTNQFAYWIGLGSCDAILCVFNKRQRSLESGHATKIWEMISVQAFIW